MRLRYSIRLAAISLFFFSQKLSAQIKASAILQINSLVEEKNNRTPVQRKIDSQIWYDIKMQRGEAITPELPSLQVNIPKDQNGNVLVDIRASVTDELLLSIKNKGGKVIHSFSNYNRISASLPLQVVEAIASLTGKERVDRYSREPHRKTGDEAASA